MTTPSPDRYTHGHHPSVVSQHARRTAEADAAYLLSHLQTGLRLLDVGCGPGSITLGLARRVAPIDAVGVDLEPAVLADARARAAAEGVPNVRFEAADAYALPFDDDAFDVVHAHQLLQHLARPVEALREWRRVLAPGGLVAVRDADYGTMSWWPRSPLLERFFAIYAAVAARNGADADAGRRLPAWVRAAGYVDLEVSATTMLFATVADIENWGGSWAERALRSSVAEQALAHALTTPEELERIAEAWRAWSANPEACFLYVNVAVLARAPSD